MDEYIHTLTATHSVTELAPYVPAPVASLRHISVGAFFDRFGSEKLVILSSADLMVQALVKDASVRKYIDLDRADLPGAVDALISKGFSVTRAAIIDAPVMDSERP